MKYFYKNISLLWLLLLASLSAQGQQSYWRKAELKQQRSDTNLSAVAVGQQVFRTAMVFFPHRCSSKRGKACRCALQLPQRRNVGFAA